MPRTFLKLGAVMIVLIAGLYYFYATDEEITGLKPTAGETVIAFGDSITEGVGTTSGNDYVSRLSREIGRPVANAGRGGDTTATALARLERDVLSKNPRVVIVFLGGNDMLARVSKNAVRENLNEMVRRIRERGAGVILVGINPLLVGADYREVYSALAETHGAVLVPDVLDDILGNNSRMDDRIHPNDNGHAILAERILPALRYLLD